MVYFSTKMHTTTPDAIAVISKLGFCVIKASEIGQESVWGSDNNCISSSLNVVSYHSRYLIEMYTILFRG